MHRRNCSTVNTTGSLCKQFYLLFYCHDEEGCFDLDISSPISKQFLPSPSRAGRCKVQWPQLTPEIRETFEQMQRHSGEGRETETSLSWPSSLSAEFTIIAVAGEGEGERRVGWRFQARSHGRACSAPAEISHGSNPNPKRLLFSSGVMPVAAPRI